MVEEESDIEKVEKEQKKKRESDVILCALPAFVPLGGAS